MFKAFVPGRPALDGVDFEVHEGEIHALLGENGAGKSTLMNVLIGLVQPDAGCVELAGRSIDLAHFGPAEALRAGIGMVHQHSTLVPAMTVEENLFFADPAGGRLFHPARARARAAELAERFALDVPLRLRAADLSVGQRQRAELLRVLDRGAGLLVLDEPTAVLTPGEVAALFAALRRLREAGRALIFISHKLDEVREIADRVTVLRRGRRVATLAARDADARALGRLMLGGDLAPLTRTRALQRATGPAFALRGLSAPGLRAASRLRDLELSVYPGEIVGVTGIDGNGQRELEEVLAGARRPTAGGIEGRHGPVKPGVRSLRRAGVAQLSSEPLRAGLIAGLSLAENFMLKASYDEGRFVRGGWLRRAAARSAARAAAERFGIAPAEPDADVATLSGGNAQKLAVARELDGDPAVLVAFNPTQGLDLGSARFVHEQLLARRAAGGAVLLVSTDLDEVLALADRVLALVRGRLVPVPAGADRAEIGAILLGGEAA